MKNKIIQLIETSYTGYKITVDLNDIKNVCFGELWAQVFEETKEASKNPDEYYIGYQDYKSMSKAHKVFDYYALAPSKYFNKTNDDHHFMTIKAGEYILFRNTFSNHGPAFFKRVYHFVHQNNIKVERAFDFEFLPIDFQQNHQESVIYVGLKLL